MIQDIYDPLSEYINVFHDRFKNVAEETFAQLAEEAKVNVEANRETCQQIYLNQEKSADVSSSITKWTILCAVLWLCVIGGAIYAFYLSNEGTLTTEIIVLIATASLLILIFLFMKVHPSLRELKKRRNQLESLIAKLKGEAWEQMAPLNRLYDWDVLTRMMSKTVPRLEFDPYFTTQRLADLKMVYNWDDSFNTERSVIYSHSGLINGNPFVICRTRKMEWGKKVYTGTKTIHWTTRERDTDGKYHTVRHTQVLTANVTAPYPGYYEKTRLIYGNTAAPDLIFNRKQSGLADKEGSLSYKWKIRSLRKKARDLKNKDFAMMSNEEFEVAFNTSDRNNNQQFALLFTPLAQENMLKLLKNHTAGYGDDFDFLKHKMINTIIPQHMQSLDLDMNPKQYQNFDYDKAQKDFYTINAQYFRAIYFSLAPLLCVPMYQQIRSQQDIYGHDMKRESAFWEHEALANFWGQSHFKHPQCVTQCILKTQKCKGGKDNSTIKVSAYGYRTVPRVTYVSVWGGDGKMHRVPVHWDEYLPVTGVGYIDMKEDNIEDASTSQTQRLNHINNVLKETNLNVYRRHIASKIQ